MVAIFTDKKNEQATLALSETLEAISFPEHVHLTINNLEDAESGVLRQEDREIDISLAHCFLLEDVVRELVGLVARGKL